MHKRVVWTVKMAHQKRGWLSGLIQSLRTTLGINEHNWLRQVLFWLPPWYIKAPNHCGCAPSHILSTSSYQMQYYTCLLLRIWRTFLCIQRKFPSSASEHRFVFHTDLKPSQPHQNSGGRGIKRLSRVESWEMFLVPPLKLKSSHLSQEHSVPLKWGRSVSMLREYSKN